MRKGEIIRTPTGIVRCDPDDHEDWLFSLRYEIATVGDLFEAAGYRIPTGCIYARVLGELAAFREIPDGGYARFVFRAISTANGTLYAWVAEGVWSRQGGYVDLSRLPALDAWEYLPESIKAVVK